MELLTTAIFPKEFPKNPEKHFYLCSCDSLESLADRLSPSSKYFGLLIMADASGISAETIAASAKSVIAKGLASLCAWGSDCERVHDIFDSADVAYEIDPGRDERWSPSDVVMASWHANESLAESIWFFINCAFPTDYFRSDCNDWIVAVVGNKDWEKGLRTEFSRIETEAREYRNSTK